MALDTQTDAAAVAAHEDDGADMRVLPLDEIVESKRNTRTNYNPVKLQELADSIKATGVHQPILVRPLPASRLQDSFENFPKGKRPGWEIVAGHRRFRASRMAGKTTIPALVRRLDDAQALKAQLIENLQRDDLHPMEEAEGYARLIEETGLKKEDVGEQIGKSRSYVYGRLKLLELCQEARKAFYEGSVDASRALMVARVPDSKLQVKAMEAICRPNWQGEPMSVREASRWLEQNVMLRLDAAPFDRTVINLVADTPACGECHKRTGADRDLFADIKSADVCTDPKCFKAKTAAHEAEIQTRAKAKGTKAIVGEEAKKLRPKSWDDGIVGHVRLDEKVRDASGKEVTLRKALGKSGPVPLMFVDPHNHKIVEILPADAVRKALAESGSTLAGEARLKEIKESNKADAEKAQRERDYEARWRMRAAGDISAGVRAEKVVRFEPVALRHLLSIQIDDLFERGYPADLAKLWGLPGNTDEYEVGDALQRHVDAAEDVQLGAMVLDALVAREFADSAFGDRRGKAGEVTTWLAKACGISLEKVQADVKAEMRAEANEAKKPKPSGGAKGDRGLKSAATSPAAQAGVDAKGKPATGKAAAGKAAEKISAEEAQSGIAEAMQAAKPAIPFIEGDVVRLKLDLTRTQGGKSIKFAKGTEGTVTRPTGDRAYDVHLAKDKGGLIADYTELELVKRHVQPTDAWPFPSDTTAAAKKAMAEADAAAKREAALTAADQAAKKAAKK